MTTTPTAPAPTATSPQPADTYDWDTAFGVRFGDANAAIVAKSSSPPSFDGSWEDPFSGETMAVKGAFGPWQLAGGSGSIVHMALPVTAGSLTPQGGAALDWSGTATIEVYLNYLPQPGAADGTPQNLVVQTTGADGQPVATVQGFTFDPASPWSKSSDPITSALQTWLEANLQDFNHVFSVVVVNDTADQGSFQWLKPTKIGYAVNTPVDAAVDDYVLGVLAMTEGRDDPNLSYVVSPNIIPAGANAGFLIAQERFLEKIFMPGVYLLFQNASTADFDTTNDGATITNIQPLAFQKFTLEDGTVIADAAIDTGGFTLTAFDQTLELQFSNLKFSWKGGYIVHLTYTGASQLYLDTGNHLQMRQTGTPSLNTIVTKTTREQWSELVVGIVEGIGLSILGALVGGALGPAADAAEDAASETISTAATEADGAGSDLSFDIDGLEPDSDVSNVDEVESQNDSDASEDLENADDDSYTTKFKGWFGRNWSKLLGLAIGGALGAVMAKIPDIMETYAEKNLADMPTLDSFADAAVSSTSWPGSSGYTIASLSMNRALVFGLNVSYTT
jgi:hypothetical protein